jgi:hypothetical protein
MTTTEPLHNDAWIADADRLMRERVADETGGAQRSSQSRRDAAELPFVDDR